MEIKESVKELVRTAIIAVIPVAIDGLSAGQIDLKLLTIAGAIALLRAIDKLLHTNGIRTPLDMGK